MRNYNKTLYQDSTSSMTVPMPRKLCFVSLHKPHISVKLTLLCCCNTFILTVPVSLRDYTISVLADMIVSIDYLHVLRCTGAYVGKKKRNESARWNNPHKKIMRNTKSLSCIIQPAKNTQ